MAWVLAGFAMTAAAATSTYVAERDRNRRMPAETMSSRPPLAKANGEAEIPIRAAETQPIWLVQALAAVDALDALSHAAAVVDRGVVVAWNAAAARLLGWDAASIVNSTVPFLHHGDIGELQERVQRALRERHPVTWAVDGVASDNRRLPLRLILLPLGEDRTHAILAIADERRTQAMERVLRDAFPMVVAGGLLRGILHDVNNILGLVIGNLDLLDGRARATAAESDGARDALAAALRGADLVRTLNALLTAQPSPEDATDLKTVIHEVVAACRRTVLRDRTIDVVVDDDLWSVQAERLEICLLLLALAVRARFDRRPGGPYRIEACNEILGPPSRHLPSATEVVRMVVAFGGEPLPATAAATLTDESKSLPDRAIDGGLILAMAAEIAAECGGELDFDNGAGATNGFAMLLPRAQRAACQSTTLHADAGPDAPKRRPIVLVVEDDSRLLKLSSRQLEGMGYSVIPAANGVLALGILKSDQPIDLLFSDIMMPGGVDGRQLAREGKRLRPHLKILLTSGFVGRDESDSEESAVPGDFLAKPFRKWQLEAAVKRLLLDSPSP
jgi:PAS domain S-box-containing protein